jgi:hypothetical protein
MPKPHRLPDLQCNPESCGISVELRFKSCQEVREDRSLQTRARLTLCYRELCGTILWNFASNRVSIKELENILVCPITRQKQGMRLRKLLVVGQFPLIECSSSTCPRTFSKGYAMPRIEGTIVMDAEDLIETFHPSFKVSHQVQVQQGPCLNHDAK